MPEAVQSLDLLAIGEAMAELRWASGTGWQVGFAGDTFNTAVYCQRELAIPGSAGFHSHIGCDPLSVDFLSFAKAEGIATASIRQKADRNLGIYSVSTNDAGERSFHYWRTNSAARGMFASADLPEKLSYARILYFSGITLAILTPVARQEMIGQLRQMRAQSECLIAFDSNYRPLLWENKEAAREVIADAWSTADIALPSIDDEMDLFGESKTAVIRRFAERNWTACAIKRSAAGPLSPRLGEMHASLFPAANHVVDTTAAGDSFNGAYLAAFLQGRSEAACLQAGHRLASQIVGFRGAIVERSTEQPTAES